MQGFVQPGKYSANQAADPTQVLHFKLAIKATSKKGICKHYMKFLPTVSSTLIPQQNEKVARDFKRIFAVILINDSLTYVM